MDLRFLTKYFRPILLKVVEIIVVWGSRMAWRSVPLKHVKKNLRRFVTLTNVKMLKKIQSKTKIEDDAVDSVGDESIDAMIDVLMELSE